MVSVANEIPPETTLNTYIRNYAHAKGTKFMCQEGGCGACIVAVKRKNPVTQETEIFAVNSVSKNESCSNSFIPVSKNRIDNE